MSKKITKEEKLDARLSISDLITDDLPSEVLGTVNETDVIKRPEVEDDKYFNIKKKAENKASKAINSILKFYLDADIIEKEEYIKAKIKLENRRLSSLMYLLDTSEKSLTQLLSAIDGGDMGARMFEVLSQLQKTMLDIIKSETMYMMSVEENIKKMKSDVELYGRSSVSTASHKKTNSLQTRGTKDLMKALQNMQTDDETDNDKLLEQQNIEDIE